MLALRSRFGSKDRAEAPASIRPGGASGTLVLPRFLRRPARLTGRLVCGEIALPRYGATIMSLALIGGFGIYGAIAGGHMPTVARAISSATGFAVEDVRVTGQRELSEIDVLGVLELDGMTSLVGIGAEAARQRVATLPWVEQVSVRKAYPSALEIDIVERQPFAIWQSGRDLALIEANGAIIVPLPGQRFADLPLVVGLGAPEAAAQIIAAVAAHGEIAQRVRAYIRVGERRWDLRFDNGVTVKLPERGLEVALAELEAMERVENILARDVVSVDMRLADRLVVQLTSEGAERRAAFVEERARKLRQRKGA